MNTDSDPPPGSKIGAYEFVVKSVCIRVNPWLQAFQDFNLIRVNSCPFVVPNPALP